MRGQLRLNVHALLPALSRNGSEICGFVDTATFLVAVQSVVTDCHKQGADAMVREIVSSMCTWRASVFS